jgi:hypothetical protein
MQDEQLKLILLKEPSPNMSKQFSDHLQSRLEMLQGDAPQLNSSKSMTISLKKNYWQYLIMSFMLIAALTILNLHHKNDHLDDELSRIDPMTELTLSTL